MKKAVATTARTLQRWGSEAIQEPPAGNRRRSRSTNGRRKVIPSDERRGSNWTGSKFQGLTLVRKTVTFQRQVRDEWPFASAEAGSQATRSGLMETKSRERGRRSHHRSRC